MFKANSPQQGRWGRPLNLLRQGVVGNTETFLASVGCEAISGQFSHPQTHERGHDTLARFLDAHARQTWLDWSRFLRNSGTITTIATGTKHLRSGTATSSRADMGSQRTPGSSGIAVDIAAVQAKAMNYRKNALAKKAGRASARPAGKVAGRGGDSRAGSFSPPVSGPAR